MTSPEDLFDPSQLTDDMRDLLTEGIGAVVDAARLQDPAALREAERSWAAAAVELLDIRIEVAGMDRVDPGARYLVAPLHEGFADVLALQLLPLDLTWVIRDELLTLPYFGEYLGLAGHIAIEPEAPRAALRTLLRRLPEIDTSVVMFPQGSLLGIEVSFQPGVFQFADRFDLPLLPIVLTGSHRVWDYPFDRTVHKGQTIHMEILSPVEPGSAVATMAGIESEMKSRALQIVHAPTRHYVPERDGLWEGYRFDLDSNLL